MDDSLIVVFQSQYLHEIYLSKHKLEEVNIKCYIRNENVMATIGVSLFDQYKLMVDKEDVEKSLEILKMS